MTTAKTISIRLDAPHPLSAVNGLWLHVASNQLYRLLHRGLLEATQEPMIVYESLMSGQTWIRPESEFFDGRFQKLIINPDLNTGVV